MAPLSESVSYMLRLLVAIMVTLSNFFFLIAISTNYWMLILIARDLYYVGIWNLCNDVACVAHSDIIQAKVLLVFLVICNILLNIFIIFSVYVGEKNSKRLIGRLCLMDSLFGLGGMILATVYFALHSDRVLLYGLPVGWVGTILIIASCAVSLIHSHLEPDDDVQLSDLLKITSNPPTVPRDPNCTRQHCGFLNGNTCSRGLSHI